MAILKRRKPQSFWRKAREMCWPSMGWARTALYYKHRMFRGGDSTHRITAGLAIGASISFTPFLGTHFVQAAFLAVLFRVNWPAAMIGTFWGNPWTFPFLFWTSYEVGAFILTTLGFGDMIALPDMVNFEYLRDQPKEFFGYLLENPTKLLLPFALGGYFAAAMFWPFAYAALFYPVKSMHHLYHKERLRRSYRRATIRAARKAEKSGQSSAQELSTPLNTNTAAEAATALPQSQGEEKT